MRIAMRLGSVLFLMIYWHLSMAQSEVHQLTLRGQLELENSVGDIIDVKQLVYPGLGVGVWTHPIIVGEDGQFEWLLKSVEVPTWFELHLPPWTWEVLVLPDESSELVLRSIPNQSMRLQGVPGEAVWVDSPASKALLKLDVFQLQAMDALYEPVVELVEARSNSNLDSLDQLLDTYDSSFDSLCNEVGGELVDQVFRDGLWERRLTWKRNLGMSDAYLDSLWNQWQLELEDNVESTALNSLHIFRGLEVVLGDWWLDERSFDWDEVDESLRYHSMDSLKNAMGPRWSNVSVEELAGAWLIMAKKAPSRRVGRVWQEVPFPAGYEEAFNALVKDRNRGSQGTKVEDFLVVSPNGSPIPLSQFCPEPWKVILLIKSESAMSKREREVFGSLQSMINRPEIGWCILTIEHSNEAWEKLLDSRGRIESMGRVGNNPLVMEELGIGTLPQVVILDPNFKIYQNRTPLPSQGLMEVIQRILVISRR
ncbi:MAG: hypothetical protein ACO2XQ_01315 [Flavobacteriales bacterium]